MQTHAPHVRHVRETLLSDNWYTLKKYTFELLRRDGRWQEQTTEEKHDRGNGADILLYNREKRTVVLTRQFRFPVFTHGHDGYLIEAAAGLGWITPRRRRGSTKRRETGFRVTVSNPSSAVFMSPGSVTEKLYFFYRRISGHDDRPGRQRRTGGGR